MSGLRIRLSYRTLFFQFHKNGFKLNEVQGNRWYSQAKKSLKLSSKIRQTPRVKPALKKRGPTLASYPLLVIPITCVGLGFWQIERKKWKTSLLSDLEDKMNRDPIELPQNLAELTQKDSEYVRVIVRGRFDHTREQFVGPRPDLGGEQKNIGVFVVTPLKLSGRSETILVNRGHVPWKFQPHQKREDGQIEGEVEFTGVVRLSETKAFGVSLMEEEHCYPNRDVQLMANMAETSPVFVDADRDSTVPGGPVGGQTRVQLRDEHTSYIITWFALAVITYYGWWRHYKNPLPHRSVREFLKREHKRL